MSEINVSVADLEEAIEKLNSLSTGWSAIDTTPPETVGDGYVVDKLVEIAQLYQDLHAGMATLISNTISFLTNTKESYETSDQQAATAIDGGEAS